mmetsp:Transcript_47767/g.103996  ORF Transcript_47767/g.103996 Transcript_47767/m.103996 type:complete len:211 (+) Transcript_47767:163-795(+)
MICTFSGSKVMQLGSARSAVVSTLWAARKVCSSARRFTAGMRFSLEVLPSLLVSSTSTRMSEEPGRCSLTTTRSAERRSPSIGCEASCASPRLSSLKRSSTVLDPPSPNLDTSAPLAARKSRSSSMSLKPVLGGATNADTSLPSLGTRSFTLEQRSSGSHRKSLRHPMLSTRSICAVTVPPMPARMSAPFFDGMTSPGIISLRYTVKTPG